MSENILIIAFALIVLAAVFMIGYFIGISDALNMIEDKPEDERRIYCLECEIDMPVEEIAGSIYCSNCGLYHGTKL